MFYGGMEGRPSSLIAGTAPLPPAGLCGLAGLRAGLSGPAHRRDRILQAASDRFEFRDPGLQGRHVDQRRNWHRHSLRQGPYLWARW